MDIRIGTSGWSYPYWRKVFYPEHLPQSKWLNFYAERFTGVELNASFYGSQALYGSNYTKDELTTWAAKIKRWQKDVFVYFDNDYQGYAVQNALRLKELCLN